MRAHVAGSPCSEGVSRASSLCSILYNEGKHIEDIISDKVENDVNQLFKIE